ncbi:NADPH-dependent F420 reductase [Pseudotabrizicola sp.]|uniref:NADPH-dependent F420 reductase n=1 Tax=Pseudotabrizicola sp. TaxID=2939647 RepID=UPI0035213B3E
MQIAIIGSGKVGSAIAHSLSGKGHVVALGVRDPMAAKVAAIADATGATVADPTTAAQGADIVILALPWGAAAAAVATLGDLRGKIVIDCMNPLGMVDGALALVLGHTSSGGETVQDWLPEARVVKTLNQVGAEIMADTAALPGRPVMFMAGNDPAAKEAVAQLLADLGFEPLDAGDITKARLLEPFGMLWINQAMARGKGRAWAFAAVDRHGAQGV